MSMNWHLSEVLIYVSLVTSEVSVWRFCGFLLVMFSCLVNFYNKLLTHLSIFSVNILWGLSWKLSYPKRRPKSVCLSPGGTSQNFFELNSPLRSLKPHSVTSDHSPVQEPACALTDFQGQVLPLDLASVWRQTCGFVDSSCKVGFIPPLYVYCRHSPFTQVCQRVFRSSLHLGRPWLSLLPRHLVLSTKWEFKVSRFQKSPKFLVSHYFWFSIFLTSISVTQLEKIFIYHFCWVICSGIENS